MGMYDEIYCHTALPDGDDPPDTCFQTKSFPDPCLFRYRITSEGRLIDSAGNALEPDGYITFYTTNQEQPYWMPRSQGRMKLGRGSLGIRDSSRSKVIH